MPSTEKTGGPGSPRRSTATHKRSSAGGGSSTACSGTLAEKPPSQNQRPSISIGGNSGNSPMLASRCSGRSRARAVDQHAVAGNQVGEVDGDARLAPFDAREIDQAAERVQGRRRVVERGLA